MDPTTFVHEQVFLKKKIIIENFRLVKRNNVEQKNKIKFNKIQI